MMDLNAIAKPASSAGGDGARWYTRHGRFVPVALNKKGEEVAPSLREARRFGLIPSVTTILQVVANYGLQLWKEEQLILSAMTLPRKVGEGDEEFMKRVRIDASAQVKEAARIGKEIHAHIEHWIKTGDTSSLGQTFFHDFNEVLGFDRREVKTEVKISPHLGYAGTMDILCPDGVIKDMKTQEWSTKEVKKFSLYDANKYQIGGYSNPSEKLAGAQNIFIDRKTLEVQVKSYSRDEVALFRKQFMSIFEMWKTLKKFEPLDKGTEEV